MSTLRKVRMSLLGILLLGSVVMFLIAGSAVFAAGSFVPHVHLGRALTVFALVLPFVAWRDGRRDLVPAGVLAVLFVLQSVTVHAAGSLPWLGALHPLLGAAVLVGLVHLMRSSTSARELATP